MVLEHHPLLTPPLPPGEVDEQVCRAFTCFGGVASGTGLKDEGCTFLNLADFSRIFQHFLPKLSHSSSTKKKQNNQHCWGTPVKIFFFFYLLLFYFRD